MTISTGKIKSMITKIIDGKAQWLGSYTPGQFVPANTVVEQDGWGRRYCHD